MTKYKNLFLILFPVLIVFSDWLQIFYFFREFSLDFKVLLNFNDIEYFPFIISLSEFNFSPSFNDNFEASGSISFPYASIIYHAFLYKLFNLSGYIFAQVIFVAISYYIIFYFLKKSGISNFASILAVLLIFFLPTFLEIINIFFKSDFILHFQKQVFDNHLTSYRYPRPLVTNIYFYLALILLIKFDNENLNTRYYILLSLILSLLLQSFIYLFILISFVLFIKIVKKIISNKNYFFKNYLNYLKFFIFFILFSSPFILQNLYSESDYSSRMGLHLLDFDNRIKLLNQTFLHFFNFKYLLYIISVLSFYFFFKKKFNLEYKKTFELYLLLIFSSLIIPFIFLLFSPYIIWYKHFFDVKNLVFILGFILILAFLIYQFNFFNKKIKLIIISSVSVVVFFLNMYSTSYNLSIQTKNNQYLSELNKLLIMIDKKISKKKLNIFSTPGIFNYYLTYKDQNILFPYGFHVSLNDNQLKTSMINSLKSIGLNENNFKQFLQNDLDWKSKNNISQISGFKYQFNSFFTYFDKSEYTKDELNFLKNNKFFLAESVALSNKKINEYVYDFSNHKIIDNLKPDLVIIDKNMKNLEFEISKEYITLINNDFFSLFVLK